MTQHAAIPVTILESTCLYPQPRQNMLAAGGTGQESRNEKNQRDSVKDNMRFAFRIGPLFFGVAFACGQLRRGSLWELVGVGGGSGNVQKNNWLGNLAIMFSE